MEKKVDKEHETLVSDEVIRLSAEESNDGPPVQVQTANLLMDWDKGLVGWESTSDPENPL
jgi:hypothetical protein